MTRFFSYGSNSIIADSIRLEDGIVGLESAADGSFSTGTIKIDDPTGVATYLQLQQFYLNETACALPRVWTGYSYQVTNNRGPFRVQAARTHTLDMADLNFLLHLQPARGSTAKRPKESGNARMAWLLASVCLDGIVFDNGLVGDNPNIFDEADYTGMFADEILPDLCVSSSDAIGRVFFVYWDQGVNQPSLFIDLPTAPVYTSTLRISNVAADVGNDLITFGPYEGSEVIGDASEIYCSVFFKYKTGTVFRHSDTTHAAYFVGNGWHRQAVFETTRVGSLETATRHADSFLAAHAGNIDTITCTVRLPPEQVNLIDAGMRLSVKFSHLPGYEAFTWTRVTRRTVLLTPESSDYYDVQLELSTKGIQGAGGGPVPGDFPHQDSPGLLSPVQSISRDVNGDLVMYPNVVGSTWEDVTVGNLLVLGVGAYDNGTAQDIPTPSGWTAITSIIHPTGFGTSANYSARLFYKLAEGGEVVFNPATGYDFETVVLTEFDGPGTLVTSLTGNGAPGGGHQSNQGNSASGGFSALTTDAGEPVTLVGWWNQTGETTARTIPWGGTYNESGDFEVAWATTVNISGTMVINVVTSSSGSERISGTMEDNNNFPFWAVAAFQGATGSSGDPPVSGQPVLYETVTPASDGLTTTFTTQHPYADGSLHVYVDRTDQTAAVTSFDGACGDFTLGFAPRSWELVEVSYQGR